MSWAVGAWKSDAWFGTAWYSTGFTPVSGSFFSEGTLVGSNGVVQIEYVAWNFAGVGGDVFLLGTRHRSDGVMYMTTQASAQTGDVFINGIRHSATGVRYVDSSEANEFRVSKGYSADDSFGAQTVTTSVSGTIDHGVLRSASGVMVVAEA